MFPSIDAWELNVGTWESGKVKSNQLATRCIVVFMPSHYRSSADPGLTVLKVGIVQQVQDEGAAARN
jgi:hypothetical protein